MAVVQGEQLSILPSDELLIEAEVIGKGRLGNFKQVSEIVNPDKTLEFSFTQMDSSVGMMLSVKNPFPFMIKYHLNMIDFSVFESWPHPIPERKLTNIRIQKGTDTIACVY
ncbi:hypothetical protein A7985_07925 [Pseudoalteromonas luteoviolacea]|uniref:Uncharacterized protein n=1 Tax=Pseudoalteromonas luteoviolacea TaxID=43657 RepID=A0A1C0TX01_9GAMM|nr:hypothetical protein [Pseudoalteromonas luteoviolacea]OCQ23856.1 hypothetical protein A7985_07925 [Pseudoalteromonas luteoviolacea]